MPTIELMDLIPTQISVPIWLIVLLSVAAAVTIVSNVVGIIVHIIRLLKKRRTIRNIQMYEDKRMK